MSINVKANLGYFRRTYNHPKKEMCVWTSATLKPDPKNPGNSKEVESVHLTLVHEYEDDKKQWQSRHLDIDLEPDEAISLAETLLSFFDDRKPKP